MAQPPKVAGYLRVSKDDPSSTTIEKQESRILAEVERRELPRPVFFRDVGVSGSKDVRRPARDELERSLSEYDLLFVNSLDRLARSTADFVRIADRALKVGCKIVVVSQPELDFTSPNGRFMAELMSILAAFEARLIGERVRQTNEYLVREGRRTGGQTPWGLMNVPTGRGGYVMRPDPETAPLVREAGERVLAGETLRSIARDFRERGILRPQADRNGDPSTRWNDTSLGRLLRRPALAGMRVFRGRLLTDPETGLTAVDPEAAIFTPEEFDALQVAFEGRGKPGKPWTPQGTLLGGLLLCVDGQPMYPNRAREQWRYVCKCDRAVSIRLSDVDPHVEAEYLARFGRWEHEIPEITEGRDWKALSDVKEQIETTAEALRTARGDDRLRLFEILGKLQDTEDRLSTEAVEPTVTYHSSGRTIAEVWPEADLETRRWLLFSAINRVVVMPAKRRGFVDLSRVRISWRGHTPHSARISGELTRPPGRSQV